MRITHQTSGRRRALWAATAAMALALTASACTPGAEADSSSSSPASSETTAATSAASTGVSDEPVTLTISDGWGTTGTGELFAKIIGEFEDKYPNVTVVRDTTDYDSYSQSILLKGSAPNPPDVMMLQTAGYGQGFYQFARSGVLLPLDDYAEAYGWADRFGAEANLDVFRFDAAGGDQWGAGPLYGLPEQNTMIVVYYNSKLLADLGITEPPTTLSEFEASLAAAKAAGITPIAQDNNYIHTFMALWNAVSADAAPINDWLYGRGGSFDTEQSRRAAATIQSWQQSGYFQDGVSGATYGDASGTFLNGKSLYYIEGSWMTGAVSENLGADGGIFQLVGDDPGASAPVGGGLSTPLTISAKSEHPDVAAAFLDFFTSKAVSDELFAGGWGPPGAEVSAELLAGTDLSSQVLSIAAPIEAQGGAGITPFIDWAAPTLTELLPAELQKLTAGATTPEEFAATIEAASAAFAAERGGN